MYDNQNIDENEYHEDDELRDEEHQDSWSAARWDKSITEDVIHYEIMPKILDKFSYITGTRQIIRWDKNCWELVEPDVLTRTINTKVKAYCYDKNRGRSLELDEDKILMRYINYLIGRPGSIGSFFVKTHPTPNRRKYLAFSDGIRMFDTEQFEEFHKNRRKGNFHLPCFNKLNFEYDKDAKCPRFLEFLKQIMCGDEELVHFLLNYLAYAVLIPHCDYEKFAVFHGVTARNGKSTLIELMHNLVGEGNYITKQPAALGERFGLSGCQKVQLITCAEVSDKKIDTSIIKSITSGESVMLEEKCKAPVNIKITGKMIFACNEAPKFMNDAGLFNRVLVFPFNLHLEEKDRDPNLINDLLAELPGIFNLLVDHAKKLTPSSFNSVPYSMEKAKNEMLYNDCPSAQFAQDQLDVISDGDKTLPRNEIYREFKNYCRDEGVAEYKIPTQHKFWHIVIPILKQKAKDVGREQYLFFSDREAMRHRRATINGKQERIIQYIRFSF